MKLELLDFSRQEAVKNGAQDEKELALFNFTMAAQDLTFCFSFCNSLDIFRKKWSC